MEAITAYQPKYKIRLVTAASLFDGHDAAINIMRRILQSSGAEIIHLGHNRSVQEIVDAAIQEDVQGIAITSYQGGHLEFFKYMYDLLQEKGSGHIKIFGGGGGTILPHEVAELQSYGIARIYSPDDGRQLGLQGMINDLLAKCDFPVGQNLNGELNTFRLREDRSIARMISAIENYPEANRDWLDQLQQEIAGKIIPVLGITGTGGAGKSSLVDELLRRFLLDFTDKTIAIVSVDPSKRKTGGALLGDRIRMNAASNSRVYMRSLATRQSNLALSRYVADAVNILKAAGFDLIILETSGIGQSDTEIVDHSDVSLYVMTPEYGAATQLEKIDMIDFADVIAINKFDKRGALDALRDVKKQYQRAHQLWQKPVEEMPVFGTIASQFNDPGMNRLYQKVIEVLVEKTGANLPSDFQAGAEVSEKVYIIPPQRSRYLSEIAESNRAYERWVERQTNIARQLFALHTTVDFLRTQTKTPNPELIAGIEDNYKTLELHLEPPCKKILAEWAAQQAAYAADEYVYTVRGKEIRVPTFTTSLSHTRIPRV
nr:cobalamin-dependent protein [Haliscomenobacter sp.]